MGRFVLIGILLSCFQHVKAQPLLLLCDSSEKEILYELPANLGGWYCGYLRVSPQDSLFRSLAVTLNTLEDARFVIVIHSDLRGSAEMNWKLSLDQGEMIRRELSKFGVDTSRVSIIAKGESEPLIPESAIQPFRNDPKTYHTLMYANRRVVLYIRPKEE